MIIISSLKKNWVCQSKKKKKQTDKEEHHVTKEMNGVICLNREIERQRKTRARWTESKLNGLWWGLGWCCETWLKPPRHQQGAPGLQQGFTSTHARFTENYIKENTEKHKAASWFWQQSTLLNHIYWIRSGPSHQFTAALLVSGTATRLCRFLLKINVYASLTASERQIIPVNSASVSTNIQSESNKSSSITRRALQQRVWKP